MAGRLFRYWWAGAAKVKSPAARLSTVTPVPSPQSMVTECVSCVSGSAKLPLSVVLLFSSIVVAVRLRARLLGGVFPLGPSNCTLARCTELLAPPKPSRSKNRVACVWAATPCRSTVTTSGVVSGVAWPDVPAPAKVTSGPKKTSPVCWMFSNASVWLRPTAVPTSEVPVAASSKATSKASGGVSAPLGCRSRPVSVNCSPVVPAGTVNVWRKPLVTSRFSVSAASLELTETEPLAVQPKLASFGLVTAKSPFSIPVVPPLPLNANTGPTGSRLVPGVTGTELTSGPAALVPPVPLAPSVGTVQVTWVSDAPRTLLMICTSSSEGNRRTDGANVSFIRSLG